MRDQQDDDDDRRLHDAPRREQRQLAGPIEFGGVFDLDRGLFDRALLGHPAEATRSRGAPSAAGAD